MKTVIWDVDDVLNDLMDAWLQTWWRPSHPDCGLTPAGLTANPPHGLLQIPLDQYLASLDAFRDSPRGRDLDPSPLCLAWFARHGHLARHLALTAVPLWAAPLSAAWVMRHFGRWIRFFSVVPSARPGDEAPVIHRTKAEAMAMLRGPLLFVDDHPHHIAAARAIGVDAYLFPRPWDDATGTAAQTLGRLAEALRQ